MSIDHIEDGMILVLHNGDKVPILVGMEATVSYGSDSRPALVKSVKESRSFIYLELEEYQYQATEEGKKQGMGHQDWEILWDRPLNGVVQAKIRKSNGKYVGSKSFSGISLGCARVYYCWEL